MPGNADHVALLAGPCAAITLAMMSGSNTWPTLPEPPAQVTSEPAQDRRLVRQMLALTPSERLQTLTNWARLASASRSSASSGDE